MNKETKQDVDKLYKELSWNSRVDPTDIQRSVERLDCVECGIVQYVRLNAYPLSMGPPQCIADRIEQNHQGSQSGLTGADAKQRELREQRAWHEQQIAKIEWSLHLIETIGYW